MPLRKKKQKVPWEKEEKKVIRKELLKRYKKKGATKLKEIKEFEKPVAVFREKKGKGKTYKYTYELDYGMDGWFETRAKNRKDADKKFKNALIKDNIHWFN